MLIVDIDPKSGGNETWAALEAKLGKVPPTLEVRTPSGGRHLYFRGIGPSTAKKLGAGIDTRGIGGYALLPPSSVNGRHYTWLEGPISPLPEWIAEILATEADPSERSEEHTAAYEAWRDEGNDGGRLAYYLSLIGDHAGGEGFYGPMTKAAGYGARLGMPLEAIVARIAEAALNADGRHHTLSYIQEKIAQLPQAIRAFQVKDAARLENEEPDGEEPDAEEDFEEPLEEPEAEDIAEEEPEPEEAVGETADATSKAAEGAEEPEPNRASPRDPRETAVGKVRQYLKSWLRRGKKHDRGIMVLQLPAGFGKTHNMLIEQQHAEPLNTSDTEALLHEDLGDLPEHGFSKLACSVSRHALAKEIQEADAALRPIGDRTRIPILTGRNAENCKRWEIVQAGFKKGFSQASFCRQELPNGSEVLCPFFADCQSTPGQYQHTQEAIQKAPNAIVMHSHLAIPWLRALALKTRTRMWMDENPTGVFRARQEFDAAQLDLGVNEQDFATLEQKCADDTLKGQRRMRKAFKALANLAPVLLGALTTPSQGLTLDLFADWSPKEIRGMADARELIETWRRGKLDPSLDDATLKKQLAKRKPVPRLSGLLERLADEREARKTGAVYSLGCNPKTGRIISRGRIPTDDLPPNLLITDATVSPEIIKAVFPGHKLEHIKIEVPRNAYIIQVKDRTFSRNWLVNKGHLPEVTTWFERLSQYYKNLVVITTKHIRCLITEEANEGSLPVYCETHGFKIAHYGNIRGSNAFKDCDALVILGREQPPPEDIEGIAKAVWYDAKKPLRKAVKRAGGGQVYNTDIGAYEMTDGTIARGEVEVHPDPRCQAVLADARENEMIQAIDRARLIWNPTRKPIYILCSIPLPGVKVDQLISWDNLRGTSRLHQALSAQVARGESALPLCPCWLTEHFPLLWNDHQAAKNWAVRDPQLLDIMRKCHGSNKYLFIRSSSRNSASVIMKDAGGAASTTTPRGGEATTTVGQRRSESPLLLQAHRLTLASPAAGPELKHAGERRSAINATPVLVKTPAD